MIQFRQTLVGDLIAVQPVDEMPTRIKLPDWQRNLRGHVIGVGPGAPLPGGGHAEMQTKVGDLVVYGAATGMESVYCNVSIRIMKDSDVDAVLGEDEHATAS